jgi:UDPglucose 6-dehydrogenase
LLGATVTVYDPMATGNALTEYPELSYADSALAALHRADVTVVAAAWPEFAEIDPAMARSVAASMAVVDACQGIDLESWQEAGWSTLSLTGGSGVDRLTRHAVCDTGFL